MTDLRTRIAAAALNAYEGRPEAWEQYEDHPYVRQDYLEVADAVIRELGLRPEYGHLNHEDSGRLYDTLEHANQHHPLRGETLRTRLITNWTDVPAG